MNEIVVNVVRRKNANLYLRYTDPVTGKRHEKNSGTKSQKKAQRAAGEWQAELNTTGADRIEVTRWDVFKEAFEEHYLSDLSEGYVINVLNTFSVIDSTLKPDKLSRMDERWLQQFKAKVKPGRSDATVHKFFQHLKTALKWAVEQKYIHVLPAFPKIRKNAAKSKKHMKGRAVTEEEFDRMIAAVPKTFRQYKHETEELRQRTERSVKSIQHLLRGLWLSGLRLGEALSLTWDQWGDGIRIEIDDDKDVYLLIDSTDQKNRDTQLYPVVDDFAAFLLATPKDDRSGFVFNVSRSSGEVSRRVDTISDWLVDVGKAARVKVDIRQSRSRGAKVGEMTPVWASAHDLRRGFGTQWARIIDDPKLLMRLMRHSSIETTLKYYIQQNAKDEMRRIRNSAKKVNDEVNRSVSGDTENAFDQ
ncbi:MAG: tyrosine-type recombinase/integrase [Fuerstiella sp.]